MSTYKEVVQNIKSEIKDLAVVQKTDKALRKPTNPDEWGFDREASNKSFIVQSRKARITSLLNLYNELRGREYRHHVSDAMSHDCLRYSNMYREKYAIDEICASV